MTDASKEDLFAAVAMTVDGFCAMLAEAQNPATPAERLEHIWHIGLGYYHAFKDNEGSLLKDRIKPLFNTLATNPNISMEMMSLMMGVAPKALLENPALPLLLLAGDFSKWDRGAFHGLRSMAREMGHPLYSKLRAVCCPEWRSILWWTKGMESCHSTECLRCASVEPLTHRKFVEFGGILFEVTDFQMTITGDQVSCQISAIRPRSW